jgi:hypothetical protein
LSFTAEQRYIIVDDTIVAASAKSAPEGRASPYHLVQFWHRVPRDIPSTQEEEMARLTPIVVASILLLVLLPCSSVSAAELGFLTICKGVSGPELSPVDPTASFTVDAPFINAIANIKHGSPGTKVRGTWISVDAISTPNYEILSTEVLLESPGTVNAHFEISKPTKGWPKGNYRVDVSIDGKPAGSANFSVQ